MKEFDNQAYASTPPAPSAMPEGYATPQNPQSYRKPPIDAEEAEVRSQQFRDLTLRGVVEAVVGVFTGDKDASTQLSEWAASQGVSVEGLTDGTAASLPNTHRAGHIISAMTGRRDSDAGDLSQAWTEQRSGGQQTVDIITTKLFGWVGSGFRHDDAEQALYDQAATTAQLAAAVAELMNDRDNQANGGVSAYVDFTKMPSTAGLPGFDIDYYGSGSSYMAIRNGGADTVMNYGSDRDAIALYMGLASATDYQLIGAAYATAPEYQNGNEAYNYLFGRMNASASDYIYVRFGKYSIELGAVVGGVGQVIASRNSGFSFKSNAVYYLACGTVGGTGGARVFQVLEGSNIVLQGTELGTFSKYGEDPLNPGTYPWRYAGLGVHMDAGPVGYRTPGRISAWAFGDNVPTTVFGSGGVMFRASTSAANLNPGTNLFPNNFFDNFGEQSGDVDRNLTTGRLTANAPGWFTVDAAVGLNDLPSAGAQLVLFKNGTAFRRIGSGSVIGNNGTTPMGMGGSVTLYLAEGDYLQLGYVSGSPFVTANAFTGDVAGTRTYFSMALANRSNA